MNCHICNREIETTTTLTEHLMTKKLCYECNFWLEKDRNGIIDWGNYYHVEPDTDRGPTGMGGRLYRVHILNGETFHTRNLWHEGKIPDRFRDRLPDNARVTEITHCDTFGIRGYCDGKPTHEIGDKMYCDMCAHHIRKYLDTDHYEDDRERREWRQEQEDRAWREMR